MCFAIFHSLMTTEEDTEARAKSQGRTAQILMGVIFLIAGLPKTWDPGLFYWDVVPYTFLFGLDEATSRLIARGALSLGPIECIIGVAMLMNWRRAIIYPIATALMAGFTVLVTLAWLNGYDESCGCFGSLLERSAEGAIVEDVLMLVLLVFGWASGRGTETTVRESGTIMTVVTFVLLIGGAVQVSAARERIDDSDLTVGVSLSDVSISDEEVDLGSGDRVIVIMTPTCARCRRAVPKLNSLSRIDGTPEIVGLTHYQQDEEELTAMREKLKPEFPILTLTKKDFMRLAWGHGVPRVALLNEGVVTRVWEAHAFPNAEDLISSSSSEASEDSK
jgi:hypothetical protein